MGDTAAQLLISLNGIVANHESNLTNARSKIIVKNGRALAIRATYTSNSGKFIILVKDELTGLQVSSSYDTYSEAITTYDGLVSD